MQVHCPNCGEKVTAQNINIQKMTAVCAACDTVFPIDVPDAKAKRRKVKPPAKLTVHDTETLALEFRTNFRLDRSEAFIGYLFGGVSMAVLALLLIGAGRVPPILPLVFLLSAFACFYGLALIAFNKTHIEMDEEAIRVARKPVPGLLNRGDEIPLAGVTAIKYEETAISKKEAYDTPRYRVWAETVDGIRRTIVNDVTEAYAAFVAQSLEERLHMAADPAVSRLEDDRDRLNEDVDMNEAARASQKSTRQ